MSVVIVVVQFDYYECTEPLSKDCPSLEMPKCLTTELHLLVNSQWHNCFELMSILALLHYQQCRQVVSLNNILFPQQQSLACKERNVLFNDTLNTFYLQFYGVRHMVKDHSDSERKPTAATWATLSD